MIPQVSILIPTYNGAEYIASSLESALSQSFSDFEVVVCDDGSKDETVAIVRKYQKKDPRVKFFQNQMNMGLVQNWNHTLMLARGEWIKFLFQDDLLGEKAIERMLAAASPNMRLVFSQRKYIFQDGTDEERILWFTKKLPQLSNLFPGKVQITAESVSQAAFKNFPLNIVGEPVAMFFHKSLVEQYGFFNKNLIQLCDLEYPLRIASHEGLIFIDEPLVTFRVHGGSSTTRNFSLSSFRSSQCEQLILLHEMVFSPNYENFRNDVLRGDPRVDFVNLFAYYARNVYKRGRSDESERAHLNKILSAYPMADIASKRVKVFSTVFNRIFKVIQSFQKV